MPNMKFLRRFLKSRKAAEPPEPAPTDIAAEGSHPGPFAALRAEIVQYIAEFLPVSAATALASCSHGLRTALGEQH